LDLVPTLYGRGGAGGTGEKKLLISKLRIPFRDMTNSTGQAKRIRSLFKAF